jgi:small subunit ribosomal protein S13
MPRIIGVDIPREKRMDVALTYLYGVGKTLAKKVLLEAKVDFSKRAKDLTEAEVSVLTGLIQREAKVEGDLRRDIQQNIKRLMDIRCYRGQRHLKGLPCRGQRTHTNARTRKGKRKTVGGLNRQAPAPK